ncbi:MULTISPECIES: hypothetical protein [Bacillus]|uniref:hypothetical protein n=1 Tax=Bacillus TaxID=1386 RepID=UPI000330898D|nr:hypothetical protein [Bacillus pseudomycoides]EOP59317.1 hypothetical protein IIW_04948 [Bacillus cereus VD136]EOP72157.1 hypothetical protein KOW_05360 [Bacillus cereus VDM006]EOQ07490.1 hypothetical protein KOY_05211 [Bacillus cereus VDM021]PEI82529.1 hypothetical protein CN679_27745 [Bacillus pseudomycoides]
MLKKYKVDITFRNTEDEDRATFGAMDSFRFQHQCRTFAENERDARRKALEYLHLDNPNIVSKYIYSSQSRICC